MCQSPSEKVFKWEKLQTILNWSPWGTVISWSGLEMFQPVGHFALRQCTCEEGPGL